tara:strand:- start:762 stop:1991 length:1230 start_codon:yes stop_codon:yes gene_type:complete
MKIWLLTIGEPIPQDGDKTRLLRTGQFAKWLADNGHDVTFINSSFDHYKKEQRFEKSTTLEVKSNYRIVCLYGRSYTKTISLKRFMSHVDIANSFRSWLHDDVPEAPDIILASYPIEELCRAALQYAKPLGIAVVIDCRDFWPDIFAERLPKIMQKLGPLIFYPFEKRARETLGHADALVGMTESALKWGCNKARRPRREEDIIFPFTYEKGKTPRVSTQTLQSLDGKLSIVFFGTLSYRIDLDLFVRASAKLPDEYKKKIVFRIAGDGDQLDILKKLADELNAPFEFFGWIEKPQITELLASADLGLLPYSRTDFHLTLPNKFSEYLSGSTPVFSCTDGEVKKFLNNHGCGVWVRPDEEEITLMLKNLIENGIPENSKHNSKIAFEKNFAPNIVFPTTLEKLQKLVTH